MFFPRRESVRLLLDQFSKPQSVVKFTHQDQAAVGMTREPWKATLRVVLKKS